MKIKAKKGRMEIIFPVILFLVFTLSALFVILFAARTYQRIVEQSNSEYDKSTALNYISRKIYAADEYGNISTGKLNNEIEALTINEDINGSPYITYIYVYDGALRELFTANNGNEINPMGGTVLFAADSFIPEIDGNLLSLTITKGEEESVKYVSLHSKEEIILLSEESLNVYADNNENMEDVR